MLIEDLIREYGLWAVFFGVMIEGDAQVVLVDTPGIFAPKRRLDRAMVSAAWEGAEAADAVLLMVDPIKQRRQFTADCDAHRNLSHSHASLGRIALVMKLACEVFSVFDVGLTEHYFFSDSLGFFSNTTGLRSAEWMRWTSTTRVASGKMSAARQTTSVLRCRRRQKSSVYSPASSIWQV